MKFDVDQLTEEELIELNHKIVERLRLLEQMRAHGTMMRFTAPSHDILDLRRCICAALKAQGISDPLHPRLCGCRYFPDGTPPLSTDLRPPNPRSYLRIRRSKPLS